MQGIVSSRCIDGISWQPEVVDDPRGGLLIPLAKKGNAAGAEDAFCRMRDDGVEANAVTGATVLHACAKHSVADAAPAWLMRITAAGIEPSAGSSNSIG